MLIWCHMLILHDAISIFISPTPNFLNDFVLEQFWQNCKYLPYCRVWEGLPLLKICPRWSFMKLKWVSLWPFYGCKHPLAPGLYFPVPGRKLFHELFFSWTHAPQQYSENSHFITIFFDKRYCVSHKSIFCYCLKITVVQNNNLILGYSWKYIF